LSSKSEIKRRLILDSSEKVFIQKGYNAVTMKDLIEACGISRGGIYLYYGSVDDVFMDVIRTHNAGKLEKLTADIDVEADFEGLIDSYFAMQKNRLRHMENSLTRAMYEFFLSHKEDVDETFLHRQFHYSREMILSILARDPRSPNSEAINALADLIMFVIEGMSMLAMADGLSEATIDAQFAYLKSLILTK